LRRKTRQNRYATRTWVDVLPDVPVFIIGNGPSVNDENLQTLEKYFTIGINRAFYKLDPTILLWQDISLWNSEYHKLHNLQALKVCRDIADPRRIYYNFYLKSGPYRFDTTKTHILYGAGSSGPLAVQLAVAMGCRPIVLIGMDCEQGPNKETDFYGNNPYWLPHTLNNCRIGLEFVKKCPVEIISCSGNDLWPRQSLEQVIQHIDTKHARNRQSYVTQILRTT
jgi:hypothetical protein